MYRGALHHGVLQSCLVLGCVAVFRVLCIIWAPYMTEQDSVQAKSHR
jgi:hypothetical protein